VEPLLFDGAMGTMLMQKGVSGPPGDPSSLAAVEEIHREYIAAGAEAVTANTFSLNEIYLAKQGLAADPDILIARQVEAALRAAQGKAYVFGDIGPAGELLAPYGTGEETAFYRAFLRQAKALAACGVHGFIVETFFDLREALIALRACREAADLPVIVSLTFSSAGRGGRTMMGDAAAHIAAKVCENGGDAVGANCGDLSLEETALVIGNMKEAGLPLIAQPNAGKPVLGESGAAYHMTPEVFAQGMRSCLAAGARLLGGCCGTTPAHIAALKAGIK